MLLDPPHDHLPQPQQVGQVARQLFLGAVDAGRADDEAQPLGRVQLQHHVAQLAAGLVVFDLARDADAAQGRHQHQVAAGNADVGGERGPLGADAFLDDLHQHFVAAAKDVLNRRLDARPRAGARPAAAIAPLGPARTRRRPRRRSPSSLVVVAVSHVDVGAAAGAADGVHVGSLVGIEAALAEVLRLDVADVQEAVAADAEIDEGGLDAGLQVDDAALVDVADVVVLAGALDVELFQHAVLDDRDPALFRLRHVDEHFLLHASSFRCLPCS